MGRAGDLGERLAQCLDAARHGAPLTPDEQAAHDSACAQKDAEAWSKRYPSLQPDLLDRAA